MGEPSAMVRDPDAAPSLRVVPRAKPEGPSDAELVEKARGGDSGAARLLYDRHAPHVARVLSLIHI